MIETIVTTLEQLFEVAEKKPIGHNILNAIGDVEISGIKYQIQIQLVADKKIWIGENEVRFSECVKLHPEGKI